MSSWRLMIGDVREQLRLLPEASVQCVVTSPPYFGLRDYGTASWEGGDPTCEHKGRVKPRQDTTGAGVGKGRFAETRGLQPGKSAYAVPVRKVCRCGARRVDHQIGLEETPWEYIEALVSVFIEVRRVLRHDGTCFLNIGDAYASKNYTAPFGQSRLKRGNLFMIPHRLAIALQDNGWYVRQDNVWAKPNPMPESAENRTTRSHEFIFQLNKNERYYYDAFAVREPAQDKAAGNKVRKFRGSHGGVVGSRSHQGFSVPWSPDGSGRNRRSVWTMTTRPYKGAHFATFPPSLPEICIKAGTSERGCCSRCGAPHERVIEKGAPLLGQQKACGGDAAGNYTGKARKNYGAAKAQDPSAVKARILASMRERKTVGWLGTCQCEVDIKPCVVLDPFAGSGTTGAVALALGREFIGIELSQAYADQFVLPRLMAAAAEIAEASA